MLKITYVHSSLVAAIHALRVNVKSLAAESRIIRKEERRAGLLYRSSLHYHRTGRLREESRYAQLALAFLRKRKYESVEGPNSKVPEQSRLLEKINRFYRTTLIDLQTWLVD